MKQITNLMKAFFVMNNGRALNEDDAFILFMFVLLSYRSDVLDESLRFDSHLDESMVTCEIMIIVKSVKSERDRL